MGTKPSGDVVFFWDKILSMSKDLRKKNRLLNKTLFVQLFDTFVTVVGSFWYLEHGFSLENFLLTWQKEARPVDLAYPGNSWLVGSPKGETFCRETPQPQKRKRSKPWFAETEKGPNFSRKFIPACCKVARNCFGLTFWVTWRWRRMGPFPRNWLAWFWSFIFKDRGTNPPESTKTWHCGTLDTWSLIHVTSSRSPPGSSFGLGGHVIHVCLERLPHIFPPSERFLWPSKWQSARASCKLTLGSTLRARTFSCKHGSLVIYSAGCCSGAKLFRFDPSTGQNEDYDLSSYSKSVTWLDDGVGVGWSYNGWMLDGLRFPAGNGCGSKFALFPQTCVDPKQGLKNIRPKGSETETSVICGRLDFDIENWYGKMSKAVRWFFGAMKGGDILLDGPLCLEPCQWNRVLQDPWVPTFLNTLGKIAISDLTLL